MKKKNQNPSGASREASAYVPLSALASANARVPSAAACHDIRHSWQRFRCPRLHAAAFSRRALAWTGALVLVGADFLVAAEEFGGGNLVVTATGSNLVLEYDQDGQLVRELGAGVAGFAQPQALTFGPNGNVYVACKGSGELFEFAPTGFVQTHTVGAYTDLRSVCIGPSGAIWAIDYSTDTILALDATLTSTQSIALPAGVSAPTCLRFDGEGRLWVGTENPPQLLAIDSGTGAKTTQVTLPSAPGDVAFSATGIGMCSLPALDDVYLFNPRDGNAPPTLTAEAPSPLGLSTSFDGSWAVALQGTNEIVKFQYGSLGFITFSSPNLAGPAALTFVPWRFRTRATLRGFVDKQSSSDEEFLSTAKVTASIFVGGPVSCVEIDADADIAELLGTQFIVAFGGGEAFKPLGGGKLRHAYWMVQPDTGDDAIRCGVSLVVECDQIPVTASFASRLRLREIKVQLGRYDTDAKVIGFGVIDPKKALNGGLVAK